MTAAEYQAHVGRKSRAREKGRGNKFGAIKTELSGISFDSKKEAGRYHYLKTVEQQGEIKNLRLQVRFDLMGADGGPLKNDQGRVLFYKADFVYDLVATGETVIEDAKGKATKDYRLKKAIMASMGHQIVEV